MTVIFIDNAIKVKKSLLDSKPSVRGSVLYYYRHPNPNFCDKTDVPAWKIDLTKEINTYQETKSYYKFPTGSLPALELLLKDLEEEIIWVDRRTRAPLFPLSIKFNPQVKLFLDQKRAAESFLKTKNGIVCMTCGSGKTVLGVFLASLLKQRTAVLVDSETLVGQWKEEFRLKCHCDFPIGQVGGGKFDLQPITIFMKQTQDTMSSERVASYANQFGFLIVDEAHRISTKLFVRDVSQFNCAWKLGLTDDPERKDKLEFMIFDYIGPVAYRADEGRMIEQGKVLPMKVLFRETSHFGFYYKNNFVQLLNSMVKNEKRNERIIRDCLSLVGKGHIVGIMSHRVKSCFELANRLSKEGLNVEVVVQNVSAEKVKEIRQRTERRETQVIVGTYKKFGYGVNIPPLSAIMLVTPENSKKTLSQASGRARRTWLDKPTPLLVYYVDTKVPILLGIARNIKRWCQELKIEEVGG